MRLILVPPCGLGTRLILVPPTWPGNKADPSTPTWPGNEADPGPPMWPGNKADPGKKGDSTLFSMRYIPELDKDVSEISWYACGL